MSSDASTALLAVTAAPPALPASGRPSPPVLAIAPALRRPRPKPKRVPSASTRVPVASRPSARAPGTPVPQHLAYPVQVSVLSALREAMTATVGPNRHTVLSIPAAAQRAWPQPRCVPVVRPSAGPLRGASLLVVACCRPCLARTAPTTPAPVGVGARRP
eukprot:1824644-Prymnesium_polylepis.1